jgi:hypothetical protein
MNPEFEPVDPALEQAVSEIRGEQPDPAVVEAAAARVWNRLSEAAGHPGEHIRGCADFQALIPEYRVGRLPEARALLLKDHLHNCVACRHAYEGKVVAFPARPVSARPMPARFRWAAVAAAVVAAAGLSVWIGVDRFGVRTGRAVIQSVNGTLFEVSDVGIRQLAPGQEFSYGVELRTAKDSGAMLELRDGSMVELKARSGLWTTETGRDTTLHLARGNVIVQAAKRSSGHLYVATADCRVAVTGTVFSVEAGTKGSRISVIQGQVHVAQNNRDKVLRPGDQAVTSDNVEQIPITADISWSRNRTRLLESFQAAAPAPGRLNPLLDRLPANTVFFANIPNVGVYLDEAKGVLRQKLADNPELREHLGTRIPNLEPLLDKLRAASEYLGDDVLIAGIAGTEKKVQGPVFLAATRREGLESFLKKEGLPVTAATRGGATVFGPERAAVEAFASAMDSPGAGFRNSPCYAPAADSYREGGSLLVCADLAQMTENAPGGARYFLAEQKEVNRQMESHATLGFGGPRTGIASWLAAPSPMGTLDYISPEATFLAAFVVKSPVAIVDEVLSLKQGSAAAAQKSLAEAQAQTGIDLRNGFAASLGGEFALSLDGPPIPVPSWKLVTEVYDPARLQDTLRKVVETYDREAAKRGGKPLRTAQEVVDGRTYYTIASADGGPLLEAHYTFAGGYLVAGPTRALVARALQVKAAGTSIARSTQFQEMAPRDHYANFSAVVYQNLGSTLAPLAGVLGAFANGRPEAQNALKGLGNMTPSFIAAYGEPDRITIATKGSALALSPFHMLNGGVSGLTGNAFPMLHLEGTPAGRRAY